MSLMSDIKSEFGLDGQPRITPILCRRKVGRAMQEEVHVMVVVDGDDDYTKRDIVRFYPGITGHESYYLDDMLKAIAKMREEFLPEESVFGGMTSWEHKDLCLCAGGAKYDQLNTSLGDLFEACARLNLEVP